MPNSLVDVLIIDDCAEDREILRSLLLEIRERRYEVREAPNAAEGARGMLERTPDCVLLDYRLPDSDGLLMLRKYTDSQQGIPCPFVFVTGSADSQVSAAALLYGAQDVLPKNELSAQTLERVIDQAIIRYRLGRTRETITTALYEQEKLLRLAQETAGIGTFHLDLATRATRFGGLYFQLYGLPPDHSPLSFDEWLDLIHAEDRPRIKVETEQAIAAIRDFSYDFRVIWPDGSLHWLMARGSVIPGDGGKPARLTGVNVDITQAKLAEEGLVAANAELRQFAWLASHDLQAPLRTVSLFTELLEEALRANADELIQVALRQLRSGSRNMRELVEDLLFYAQSGGASEGDSQARPLESPLSQALENLEFDIRTSGARITWDQLPEVRSFGEELVRLFQNLIGNAIKYRRPAVPPQIHISCELQGRDWVIAVKDNGEGFPASQASFIFQPFKRLGGTQQTGTGLGLAICRRILDRNGGRIWAQSEPGEGATFFFTLPSVEDVGKNHLNAQAGANCHAHCVAV